MPCLISSVLKKKPIKFVLFMICIKDPQTRTMGKRRRAECGRRGMGRAGESNGEKMGTTAIEPQ